MRCKLLEKVQRIASRACCKAAWERKEHSTRHHAGACRKLFEKVKKLKTITVIPSKTQETGGRLAGGRMAGCGRVAVWPCGHVAMWPCGRGRVAVVGWPWPWPWPRGRVAGWPWSWPGGRVAGWLWPWPWPWPGRGRGRDGRQLKKAIVELCGASTQSDQFSHFLSEGKHPTHQQHTVAPRTRIEG